MKYLIINLSTLLILVLAENNGVGQFPAMGWNTWCTQGPCSRDYCDEKEIKEIADAMVNSGLKDLGYTYINLDDCWAGPRDIYGELTAQASEFPNGLKPVIDYVHSLGLKFGLYTCAGSMTCVGSRPGSLGHYEQDAQTFAKWNVDYVKMDFCYTSGLDPRVQYPQFSKALNTTGKKIWFEICEWGVDNPYEWAGPISNSWRITTDHHDSWSTTAKTIEALAGVSRYAGPGKWNYGDMIMTGGAACWYDFYKHCPGMSDIEYRTEFSMWAIANSPLIVATDIRDLTPIMKQVLFNKEIIDINQDQLLKAGDRISNECGGLCQVWSKPLFNGDIAVALYNPGGTTRNITVSFTNLNIGWTSRTTANVRDLWLHKNLGSFTGSFSSSVVSHEAKMLRITKTSNNDD